MGEETMHIVHKTAKSLQTLAILWIKRLPCTHVPPMLSTGVDEIVDNKFLLRGVPLFTHSVV